MKTKPFIIIGMAIAVLSIFFIAFDSTKITILPEYFDFKKIPESIIHKLVLDKTKFKVGEEIVFHPYLINTGETPVPIVHARPPFLVSIYDENGQVIQNYEPIVEWIGITTELKPLQKYHWDAKFIDKFYDFRINEPGAYTIQSEASFGINVQSSDPVKSFTVKSDSITIEIIP